MLLSLYTEAEFPCETCYSSQSLSLFVDVSNKCFCSQAPGRPVSLEFSFTVNCYLSVLKICFTPFSLPTILPSNSRENTSLRFIVDHVHIKNCFMRHFFLIFSPKGNIFFFKF